jgi:hypothetical protein
MPTGVKEDQAMNDVAERLAERYPGTPPELIASLVQLTYRSFEGRPIRDYVPVLVEHAVRDWLDGSLVRQ